MACNKKQVGEMFIGKMAGAPWDGGPLITNSINTPFIVFIVSSYWVYPLLKGFLGGVKQLGYHPKGTTIFLYEIYDQLYPDVYILLTSK